MDTIKVGDRWQARDGSIAVITEIDGDRLYPVTGISHGIKRNWTLKGLYYDQNLPSDFDLVKKLSGKVEHLLLVKCSKLPTKDLSQIRRRL